MPVLFLATWFNVARSREMSSPTTDNPDRISRAVGKLGNARPRARAQLSRAFDIAIPVSVLGLMMLGGMALRALLSFTQGWH